MTNVAPSSIQITEWANGEELALVWQTGSELKGWIRPRDHERVIETNSDPIWEGDEYFAETWAAQKLLSADEIEAMNATDD